MRNSLHHAAHRFVVHSFDNLVQPREAQALDYKLVLEGRVVLRAVILNANLRRGSSRMIGGRWGGLLRLSHGLELPYLLAAHGGHFSLVAQLPQRVEGSLDDVMW